MSERTGLFRRFFGERPSNGLSEHDLFPNPAITIPLSLEALFAGPLSFDADTLTLALRAYHPDLNAARVELLSNPPIPHTADEDTSLDPQIIGLIGWGPHVIRLEAINAPIPSAVFTACVEPAGIPVALKQWAATHQSHVVLSYAGYDHRPLERYVALAALAGVLAKFDGILTLNEQAQTAVPSPILLPDEPGEDMFEVLRELPAPLLYVGFQIVEAEEGKGFWIHTVAAQTLELPNLAMRAASAHEGNATLELFASILAFFLKSGKRPEVGDAVSLDDGSALTMRRPTEKESYLDEFPDIFILDRGDVGG